MSQSHIQFFIFSFCRGEKLAGSRVDRHLIYAPENACIVALTVNGPNSRVDRTRAFNRHASPIYAEPEDDEQDLRIYTGEDDSIFAGAF